MATVNASFAAGRVVVRGPALVDSGALMYAVIVAGRVTELHFGVLPESDETTLYFDITGVDPVPEIDDYFNEICQLFSPAPPVIPPGELAPPYPPGGTPPIPGDPGFPDPQDPGPAPLANTAPVVIVFHANAADVLTVTECPFTPTEIDPKLRTAYRMQDICAVRVQTHVVTPVAGARVVLYGSLDNGATWEPLSSGGTGPRVVAGASGDVQGQFVNVAPGFADDILLTPYVENGDDATTLELGNLSALLFTKVTSGDCLELLEGGGCALPDDADLRTDFSGEYADVADLNDQLNMGLEALAGLSSPATDFSEFVLDDTDPFAGHPSLAITLGGFANPSPGVGFNIDNSTHDDIGILFVANIPDTVGIGGTANYADGFTIFRVDTIGDGDATLCVRDGRLILDTFDGSNFNTNDLGDFLDFANQDMQFCLRYRKEPAAFRVNIYTAPACTPLVELFDSGTIVDLISNVIQAVYSGLNPGGGESNGVMIVRQAAISYDPATVFGL